MIFAMILKNALIIQCCCSVHNEFPKISVLPPQIILIKLHLFHDSMCKVGILHYSLSEQAYASAC